MPGRARRASGVSLASVSRHALDGRRARAGDGAPRRGRRCASPASSWARVATVPASPIRRTSPTTCANAGSRGEGPVELGARSWLARPGVALGRRRCRCRAPVRSRARSPTASSSCASRRRRLTASSVDPPPTSTISVGRVVGREAGRRARVGERGLLVAAQDPRVDAGDVARARRGTRSPLRRVAHGRGRRRAARAARPSSSMYERYSRSTSKVRSHRLGASSVPDASTPWLSRVMRISRRSATFVRVGDQESRRVAAAVEGGDGVSHGRPPTTSVGQVDRGRDERADRVVGAGRGSWPDARAGT